MPSDFLSPADARSYVGLGLQSVLGTAVAPTYFVAYTGPVTFDRGQQIRQIREAGADQVVARSVKDFIRPGMSIAASGRPELTGALFAYLLGTAGTPTGSGPYTHTLTKNPANPYLTAEHNIADDTIERMVDAIVSSLVVDIRKRDQGPELLLTGTLMSRSVVPQASAASDSYESDDPFIRSQATWTIDSSAATNVESATLSFNWTIDEAILDDDLTRAGLVKLYLDCEIQIVQGFNSAADRTAYLDAVYGSGGSAPAEDVLQGDFEVNFDNGAAAAANRQVTITVPVVDWETIEVSDLDPNASEAHRITRTGRMVANPGGEPVTVEVINGLSTDYL